MDLSSNLVNEKKNMQVQNNSLTNIAKESEPKELQIFGNSDVKTATSNAVKNNLTSNDKELFAKLTPEEQKKFMYKKQLEEGKKQIPYYIRKIITAVKDDPYLLAHQSGDTDKIKKMCNFAGDFKYALIQGFKSEFSNISHSAFEKVSAKDLMKYGKKLKTYSDDFEADKILQKAIHDGGIDDYTLKEFYRNNVAQSYNPDISNIKDFKKFLINGGTTILQNNHQNEQTIFADNYTLENNQKDIKLFN